MELHGPSVTAQVIFARILSTENGGLPASLPLLNWNDGCETGFDRHDIQAFRDKSVPIRGGVLVDHRGTRTGVTKPRHQFLGGRPSSRGKSSRRVTQVVKPDT